jgi:hypothetical protein
LREEYKEAALKLASEISKELNKAEILICTEADEF